MKLTVWFSDLKDFPGLSSRLNAFVDPGLVRVVRVCANFLIVVGPVDVLERLYN